MEEFSDNNDINNIGNVGEVDKTRESVKQLVDLHLKGEEKDVNFGFFLDSVKSQITSSPSAFKNFVLEKLGYIQPLTNGQEGEIYKIEFEGANYIVAKKRFDTSSLSEYEIHNKVFELSMNSGTGVKIPTPLLEFDDGKNGYVIMEYIEGQTLYTMTWQEITNKFIIPQIKKILINNPSQRFSYFEEGFIKDNKVIFESDTQAEELVMELAEILYELGAVSDNPNISERDPNRPHIKKYPVLEGIYKKYLPKINIFGEDDGIKIQNKLKFFLDEMHSEGIYHRDLGGNPRNIMFTKKGGKYEIHIIDFGMGTILKKGVECNYKDEISGGIYDNDNYVLHKIKSLTGEYKKDVAEINHEANITEIISNGKKVGLDLKEKHVDFFMSLSANIDLNKVLNDFIAGNDRMYDWFIYMKKNLDSYEEGSSSKGYNKLFVFIQLLSGEEKKKLQEKVNDLLTKGKNTKKYKYGNLFNKYLNI
ncbi:MAG: hypothetical protein QM490_05860 [Candidatus Gracilibacteria bacterium]